MKEKLIRFMAGRYGFDSLGKATIIAALAAVVLASLFDIPVLSWLAWALIIYAYFRMFSRNIYRHTLPKRAGSAPGFLHRKIFWHRERHIISTNVPPAARKSVYRKEKERSKSAVPNVRHALLKRVRKERFTNAGIPCFI